MFAEIIPVEYQNQRVLTTQQIADAFETDAKTISYNFNYNKDRYAPGKHYFYLEGEELAKFKIDLSGNSRQVEPRTPSLYLWTKKGAFMHAKSLNTSRAWDLYEGLVDFYFERVERAQQSLQELSVLDKQQMLDNPARLQEMIDARGRHIKVVQAEWYLLRAWQAEFEATRRIEQGVPVVKRTSSYQQRVLDTIAELGGQNVARADVLHKLGIQHHTNEEQSFKAATRALISRSLISATQDGNRTYYSIITQD